VTTAELKQLRASSRKIDAKQAAALSLEYFRELFPDVRISNVALEEVELLEDENCWLITLGFDEPLRRTRSSVPLNKSLTDLFGTPLMRKFKVFKVDAKTGKVISMRIRKLES
jgi:hypothetical protein